MLFAEELQSDLSHHHWWLIISRSRESSRRRVILQCIVEGNWTLEKWEEIEEIERGIKKLRRCKETSHTWPQSAPHCLPTQFHCATPGYQRMEYKNILVYIVDYSLQEPYLILWGISWRSAPLQLPSQKRGRSKNNAFKDKITQDCRLFL